MELIANLKSYASKIAIKNPYLWSKAWNCINTFPCLLPHDNSYWALKHFCTSEHDLFLDIGANSGISALTFRKISRRINKTIPILSIEPNSLHQNSLLKLKEKISYFSFMLLGAGNSQEEVCFFTPVYKGIALHTFTSSSKQQILDAVHVIFGKKVSNNLDIKEIRAKIIKIDDLNIQPTIVKIDTEGFDYQVLQGAEKTLQKMRPFFMIEACWSSYTNIETLFKKYAYNLFVYSHNIDRFFHIGKEHFSSTVPKEKNIFAVPAEKIHMIPIGSA